MDALAHLIIVVEPVMNEGGKKRFSSLAQEILVEKKPNASSFVREDSSTAGDACYVEDS